MNDVVYDSRKAKPGCVFVCLSGAVSDGHRYALAAVEKGAAFVVAERAVENCPVPVLLTPDSRYALALLSAAFFGHPAEQLKVIGITGTKGKTTTSYMVRAILEQAGNLGSLSICHNQMGELLSKRGHKKEAAAHFELAAGVFEYFGA